MSARIPFLPDPSNPLNANTNAGAHRPLNTASLVKKANRPDARRPFGSASFHRPGTADPRAKEVNLDPDLELASTRRNSFNIIAPIPRQAASPGLSNTLASGVFAPPGQGSNAPQPFLLSSLHDPALNDASSRGGAHTLADRSMDNTSNGPGFAFSFSNPHTHVQASQAQAQAQAHAPSSDLARQKSATQTQLPSPPESIRSPRPGPQARFGGAADGLPVAAPRFSLSLLGSNNNDSNGSNSNSNMNTSASDGLPLPQRVLLNPDGSRGAVVPPGAGNTNDTTTIGGQLGLGLGLGMLNRANSGSSSFLKRSRADSGLDASGVGCEAEYAHGGNANAKRARDSDEEDAYTQRTKSFNTTQTQSLQSPSPELERRSTSARSQSASALSHAHAHSRIPSRSSVTDGGHDDHGTNQTAYKHQQYEYDREHGHGGGGGGLQSQALQAQAESGSGLLDSILNCHVDAYVAQHAARYERAVERWRGCSVEEWVGGAEGEKPHEVRTAPSLAPGSLPDITTDPSPPVLSYSYSYPREPLRPSSAPCAYASYSRKMALFASFDTAIDKHKEVLSEREEALGAVKRRLVAEGEHVLGGSEGHGV
ncbi:hypothetical protein H0H92_006515, partial [Tricholoma furcatifolium]